MSYLPTLIVDGDPGDWMERSPLHTPPFPLHDTVRIDGDPPTVPCDNEMCRRGNPGFWEDGEVCGYCMGTLIRPLRADDQVTLAKGYDVFDGMDIVKHGTRPFATATVKEIDPWSHMDRDDHGYHITVTDVEAL